MGISIQRRRGTTSSHSSFTGKLGEITVDTTKWVVVVHDGSTVGGFALSRADHNHADATTSVAGFMSATDKTKLDGISGGALSYQTVQANGADQTQRPKFNLTANFVVSDDGAGSRTTVDLADIAGLAQGTYTKLTVNPKGRVTVGATLSAGDIPNLTAAKITDLATAVQAYRLDQFAVPTADLSVNSNKIINVSEPTAATDAATKNYVDNLAVGLYFKASCRAATTTNISLSAPGTSIDTVSLSSGDRILVKDQSTATQNGIYIWNGAASSMTRALDANATGELDAGTFVFVESEGSANGGSAWVVSTTGTITIGSTNITFVQFSGGSSGVVAGNGISVAGSTVSVNTASAGRIAVGSGGVDLATTGVSAGTYNSVTVDVYGRATAGSTVSNQPTAANLTALAALTTTGIISRTGSGTFAARTIQSSASIAVTNGDGVSGNPSLAVTADTTIQRVRVSREGTLTASRQEVNFIEGAGVTITQADNSGNNAVDVTIAVTGGGGGAPLTCQYVTLATDTNLTNERVLVVGAGLTLADGGAGNNVTLALQTDLGTVPSPNTVLRVRRGTTSEHSSFAGLIGEVTQDTTKKTLVVHDNSTVGGIPLAKEVHTHPSTDISGLKYQIVQISGTSATARTNLNFSSLFSSSDDAGNSRTTITLANNNTTGAGTYGSATQVPRVTIDASGLITSVTQTTIAGVAPAGSASGDLGGTYPGPSVVSVGGATAANIATSVTDTSTATNLNTASKLVKRDISGNFVANQITATLVGDVTGNVSGTAASITGNLTGDVLSVGMVTTIANVVGLTANTYGSATQVPRFTVNSKGQVTGVTNTSITGVAPGGGAGGDLAGTYPSPTVATVGGVGAASIATGVGLANAAGSAATASTIVKRDGGGGADFSRITQSVNVVSFSATPVFPLALGSIQQITLTGNVTSSSITGTVIGQIAVFDIIQDGTGSRTFVWPTNVFGGGVITATASAHNRQMFYCDGTNYYSISQMRND